MMTDSRRDFIKKTTIAGLGLPFIGSINIPVNPDSQKKCPVCIFSKHLQFLDYKDLADTVLEAGLDGVDMGAPVWDIWMLLKDLDPEWIGCQYDIRHATVEGTTAWPMGLMLLMPFIKCVVVKDSKWEMKDGKWKTTNVPLGEGMVDLDMFLGYLKEFDFAGPVSLHFEYPLYDEDDNTLTLEQKRKSAVEHITHDVSFLKNKLKAAGLT